MDAGAGGVALEPDEGVVVGDGGVDDVAVVVGDFGDDAGVDAAGAPLEPDVLHDGALERRIAGALAEAHEGGVERRDAVVPGHDGVRVDLVEVVVAMPLELLAGHPQLLVERIADLRDAPRQDGAGIGEAIAHRVAETDLDGDAALLRQLHQLLRKRQAEPVDVRARDVLEVAPRHNAVRERLLHRRQVVVHHLAARLLQLEEDMVVRDGREDARLAQPQLLDQLEVLRVRANPAGDFGELVPQRHAPLQRLAVPLAVDEELTLPDDAMRPAQTMHEVVQLHNLLRRVRRTRLLAVAERRVRDPDLVRGARSDVRVLEDDPGNVGVRELLAQQIRLLRIVQLKVAMALGHGRVLQHGMDSFLPLQRGALPGPEPASWLPLSPPGDRRYRPGNLPYYITTTKICE